MRGLREGGFAYDAGKTKKKGELEFLHDPPGLVCGLKVMHQCYGCDDDVVDFRRGIVVNVFSVGPFHVGFWCCYRSSQGMVMIMAK